MAFKEVQSLQSEVTIALGGMNKKTGKPNPKNIEGYYLGSKEVASIKSKSGKANIYFFQTAKGNIGVWGKTDLDRKMLSVTPGAMTRITQTGMKPSKSGEMYDYKVEMDDENKLDLGVPTAEGAESEELSSEEEVEFSEEGSTVSLDEVTPPKPMRHSAPASIPDAARQARVHALLNSKRSA